MKAMPKSAMVLAAGLGTRMRGGEQDPPKPLRLVARKPLLEHLLTELVGAGIDHIVVNVHYKADEIERFMATWHRSYPTINIQISDERDQRLETGGGVKKALPLFAEEQFFVCNADVLWQGLDGHLAQLTRAFQDVDDKHEAIDACLLLAPLAQTLGYDGAGDFVRQENGQLQRGTGAFVYTGIQLVQAKAVAALPDGAVSLNHLFDTALANGRLYGCAMQGQWIHVGTPEALADAEAYLSDRAV